MKRTGFFLIALVALLVHAYLTWQWLQPRAGLLRVSDGSRISLRAALEDLQTAQLVFVGELHDQPAHHAAQLEVIEQLHQAGQPLAVGLEMFRSDHQEVLDQWVRGELPLEEFLPLYYANWNFPWVYYRDIFLYAREHGLPLVGLNVSPGVIQQVARGGFRSLGPTQVAQLPVVQCVVDADYEEFIRRALGMHGSHGRTFTNFCEAQLMWDTVMAMRLLDYLEHNPQHTVVVVAGQGHAWKRGIPRQVSQRAEVAMRVIVPKLPAAFSSAELRPEDADYFWLDLELH